MLFILASHFHTVHQQSHQLSYSLRLRNRYQYLALLKKFNLKSDSTLFFEDLAKIFIIWYPIPFNELIF